MTGAAGGIGRAVAIELSKRGARGIALVDSSDKTREAVEAVNDSAGDTVALDYVGDVTSLEFRKSVYTDLKAKFGPATICVPAAGIARDRLSVKLNKETSEMEVYPVELFRQVVEVNLIAPVYWGLEMIAGIAQERARKGLKRWEPGEPIQGSVILIGSVSSLGNKGQIAYAATKAGLEGAASTMAMEGIFHGVRCSIIHPGYTDTPMVRAVGENVIRDQVLPHVQLRRLIQPEEIADAICFMISNAVVSGSLWADAGWYPPA